MILTILNQVAKLNSGKLANLKKLFSLLSLARLTLSGI